ncbi:hypothetical protein FSP39_022751 [Pinctada imbricata]|uniref:Sushi domain-containing protein n=1 Tax=Pinctada imbricata TaxID=66713 RepID=A0AA88Y5W3_PINIB|nr:hypothetical protein FSP39_022751 [Pinctada imbricata]
MRCPSLAKEYVVITAKNRNSLLPSTYRRTPGTKVTVSCLVPSAFKLVGDGVLECLKSGMWDKPVPRCISKDTANQADDSADQTTLEPAFQSGDSASSSTFEGITVPYVISICVLAVMFLCLVLMMTYLVRMRKSIDRKIEVLDRRPAYVKAVESLRSLPSLSSGAYDYFRRPHSPISGSSSHSSSNDEHTKREEGDRGRHLASLSDRGRNFTVFSDNRHGYPYGPH